MRAETLSRAHAHARQKGVSRPFYAFVRAVLTPFLRGPIRLRVTGGEHVPDDGPAILAPNHKSFVDVFLLGLATRRHVRFMAKSELFRGPLPPLLVRLGAFPVERGRSDDAAFQTACTILEQGGVVVVFPEGTRVDDRDALGAPHHGAGRLALTTGAPIVPVAIAGTAELLIGVFPKLRRVHIAFLPQVHARDVDGAGKPTSDVIDSEVWPAVLREYARLCTEPRLLGYVEPRRVRRRSRPRLPR